MAALTWQGEVECCTGVEEAEGMVSGQGLSAPHEGIRKGVSGLPECLLECRTSPWAECRHSQWRLPPDKKLVRNFKWLN